MKKIIFSIGEKNSVIVKDKGQIDRKLNVDVFFPIVHGTGGEDGSIQGLLKLLDKPFVGSDITSSAICIDKVITKRIFQNLSIRNRKLWLWFSNMGVVYVRKEPGP